MSENIPMKTLTIGNSTFEIFDEQARNAISTLQAAVGSPLVANAISEMVDTTKIYVYTGSETGYTTGHWYYYNGTAWRDGGTYQSHGIGAGSVNGYHLSEELQNAFLDLISHIAFKDNKGRSYYNNFVNIFNAGATLLSIDAAFNQGSNAIYDNASLDDLKQYLTVTAYYDDGTSRTISAYTLSGTLTAGTSTITLSYLDKTATCNVNVTALIPTEYQRVEYIESTGTQCIELDSIDRMDTEVYSTLDFQFTQTYASGGHILIGGSSADGKWFGLTARDVTLGSSSLKFSGISALARHIAELSWVQGVATGKVDDVTVTTTFTQSTTSKPFYIFGLPESSQYMYLVACKFYYATINGYPLVPCYRKADGVIGLYDRKSDTFRTNVATGTFVKGADI
jgi:hypothetical protein